MGSSLRVAVLSLAIALTGSVALTADPIPLPECQYVHVVDPCQKKLLVFEVGEVEPAYEISLDGDLAGSYNPGGVDFATVPEYGSSFVFLAQGPFLRVLHQAGETVPQLLDLDQALGLTGLWLFRVHAAPPVEIGSQTRYPLYAIGALSGRPWLLVFDQQALLAAEPDPAAALLASGPLCEDPECSGVGIDIAAGAFPAVGGIQDAYASVLRAIDGLARQRVYRVTLHEDLSFEVALDPGNDEGIAFSAGLPLSLGVAYDSLGLQAWGVFQTSGAVVDLTAGSATCALSGEPTDVEVWGPGAGLDHPNFLFVTTNVPDGEDMLLGFPAGECPGESGASVQIPAGSVPQALALSSYRSNTPWVYTANRDFGINAFHLRLTSDEDAGDSIEIDEVVSVPIAGCPYELTIRAPLYYACEPFPAQTPKPPKVDCEADPEDPKCVEEPDRNKPVDFGEE